MKTVAHKAMIAGLMSLASQQAGAISIQFDYAYDTNNFFVLHPQAKTLLTTAGNYFSGIIQDNLLAINSGGGNHFNTTFFHPGTGVTKTINDFSVAADTITIYAGGRPLSGFTSGTGGYGGYSLSGTSTFVSNAITRGETGPVRNGYPTAGTLATDFAPWGGSITFDNDGSTSWYFDTDLSTDSDVVNTDFYSVALHEIGHVLGLGTADSWHNLVSGTDFTGTVSTSVYGANVPLDVGLGHWLNNTTSLVDGVPQEAAMDPSITSGTRKLFTDLDVAALTDVGWEVSTVPVPAAVWLFGSGLLGLVAVARRRV